MIQDSLLNQSGFFRGLSERNRKALAGLCLAKTVLKRDYLFLEGEKGEAVYVLASGSIQLVKTSADGREIVVKTVEPGETFAEIVLFEQDTYPVSAIALKKSVVYRLPKRDLLRFIGEDAGFRNDFIGTLCRRLRYMADRILALTTQDVEQRFFSFLEEQYGRKEEYTLNMARKDIAAAVGTTPETLSRLLLRLKKAKKIALKGKQLRVAPKGKISNIQFSTSND
jgi:CRP/FNR family transcriptional regulator, dissimilatory nitrate respiration regulator